MSFFFDGYNCCYKKGKLQIASEFWQGCNYNLKDDGREFLCPAYAASARTQKDVSLILSLSFLCLLIWIRKRKESDNCRKTYLYEDPIQHAHIDICLSTFVALFCLLIWIGKRKEGDKSKDTYLYPRNLALCVRNLQGYNNRKFITCATF